MVEQNKLITEYDFDVAKVYAHLNKIFDERIVVLDGGMGTQIQTYRLEEEDYRGKKAASRFNLNVQFDLLFCLSCF